MGRQSAGGTMSATGRLVQQLQEADWQEQRELEKAYPWFFKPAKPAPKPEPVFERPEFPTRFRDGLKIYPMPKIRTPKYAVGQKIKIPQYICKAGVVERIEFTNKGFMYCFVDVDWCSKKPRWECWFEREVEAA